MRVLFVPLAGATHYFPQVVLAWAFRAAGHDVRVAAQPSVAGVVARSGMVAVEVGGSYDFGGHATDLMEVVRRHLGRLPASIEEARRVAATLPPEVLREVDEARYLPHVRAAEAMAAELLDLARHWTPDLVVADHAALTAPLVAETVGAPLVRCLYGPWTGSQVPYPGRNMPVAEWPDVVRSLFDRFGVEIREDYTARTVDPCPDSMQVPGIPRRVPMRYVPYNDSGVLPGWLTRPPERRRVCVTLGTLSEKTVPGSTQTLVQRILSALDGFDVEILIAVRSGAGGRLGDLPGNARVVTDMPLDLLLPGCAAIVHHGGAGNVMTAAWHAVPQVAVTQVPDNTFEAERMAGTGAGVALRADRAGVDDIAAAAASVLAADGPRAAADRLRAEIRALPSPAEVVAALREPIC
ncbi:MULTISPECIES: nucleotide disphospho-sugar-binding domain-containing protein [Actinomadura]|uniref:nucleotide disphospho-sugar-binding domain-containing protein n=1 Tax=Actinomadura TaxID=1988 RepID=UPI00260C459B|nr:nucleotide disphospho-sugar-binding domain-containing protein [Actinomadura geliboluensis]